MKIIRGKAEVSEQFLSLVRSAISVTHERIAGAGLASPEIKRHLNGVEIILSGRMVSAAGTACYEKNQISLNVRLLDLHHDQIEAVMIHEVAHILSGKLYGQQGHGRRWKELMISLKAEPTRCHSMDPSEIGRPTRRDRSSGPINFDRFLTEDWF